MDSKEPSRKFCQNLLLNASHDNSETSGISQWIDSTDYYESSKSSEDEEIMNLKDWKKISKQLTDSDSESGSESELKGTLKKGKLRVNARTTRKVDENKIESDVRVKRLCKNGLNFHIKRVHEKAKSSLSFGRCSMKLMKYRLLKNHSL